MNEISINIQFGASKDGVEIPTRQDQFQPDWTGEDFSWVTQEIGTSEQSLSISASVSTPGMARFKNLDDTNFVEIGVVENAVFRPFAKLLPGETWAGRLATLDLYGRADAAPVKLEHMILDA